MINHALTLLINQNGQPYSGAWLAEEVTDPDYMATRLSSDLEAVRRVLYGNEPDRHMLFYRSRQLLTITMATPLNEFLDALDPRITYTYRDNGLAASTVFTTRAQKLTPYGQNLFTYGRPDTADVTGRIAHRYRITTSTPDEGLVEQLSRPAQKTPFSYTPDSRQTLGTCGLTFRLDRAEEDQDWTVDVYLRPSRDLSQLMEHVGSSGEPVLNAVFGITRTEPFLTFRRLWFENRELPLRIAALTCALVYRTEEARSGTG